MRRSGDYYDMEALAVHSFGAHDRGQDIHMQAAPSQVPNPLPARHPLLHALLPFPAAFVVPLTEGLLCTLLSIHPILQPVITMSARLIMSVFRPLPIVAFKGAPERWCEKGDVHVKMAV